MEKPEFEVQKYLRISMLIGVVWYCGAYALLKPTGEVLYQGSILWLISMANFFFLTKGIDSGLSLVSQYQQSQKSLFKVLSTCFFGFLKLNSLIILGWFLYQWRNSLTQASMFLGLGVCVVVPLCVSAFWSFKHFAKEGDASNESGEPKAI